MKRNMCTHDMVVENVTFVEWFELDGEYYVEICSECYEKFGFTKEKLPALEKVAFTPCGVVGCDDNAEFCLKFTAEEIDFAEKPKNWLELYCQ